MGGGGPVGQEQQDNTKNEGDNRARDNGDNTRGGQR